MQIIVEYDLQLLEKIIPLFHMVIQKNVHYRPAMHQLQCSVLKLQRRTYSGALPLVGVCWGWRDKSCSPPRSYSSITNQVSTHEQVPSLVLCFLILLMRLFSQYLFNVPFSYQSISAQLLHVFLGVALSVLGPTS